MTEVKTTPLLMTAQNPSGWRLEDLLQQIAEELQAKSDNIAGIDHPAADRYRKTNIDIIHMLNVSREQQIAAIEFAANNPIISIVKDK